MQYPLYVGSLRDFKAQGCNDAVHLDCDAAGALVLQGHHDGGELIILRQELPEQADAAAETRWREIVAEYLICHHYVVSPGYTTYRGITRYLAPSSVWDGG